MSFKRKELYKKEGYLYIADHEIDIDILVDESEANVEKGSYYLAKRRIYYFKMSMIFLVKQKVYIGDREKTVEVYLNST